MAQVFLKLAAMFFLALGIATLKLGILYDGGQKLFISHPPLSTGNFSLSFDTT